MIQIREVKKQPRLVPNLLWDNSKPLQMVQKGAKLCSALVPKRSKRSQMVENCQNSIMNLLKEKLISATHGKKGIWPQKPNLSEAFGVKWLFFHLQPPFFFSEDVKNHVRKLLKGRKVGVTHEKMGIWPLNRWNWAQIVDDEPLYHLEKSKNNQG